MSNPVGLEESVSRLALRVRVAEHALHNPKGWTLKFGESEVRARRVVDESGITFWGELFTVGVGEGCLELRHRRQLKLARPIKIPEDRQNSIMTVAYRLCTREEMETVKA